MEKGTKNYRVDTTAFVLIDFQIVFDSLQRNILLEIEYNLTSHKTR